MTDVSPPGPRDLSTMTLSSLVLEMHAQYRRAVAEGSVPDTPRWRSYCQQQWQGSQLQKR